MSKKHRRIIYEAAIALKNAIDNNPLSREAMNELIPGNEVGRNQLLPIFKKITGDNFRRYQRQKRIEASSVMLLAGMSIKQVSIECRYNGYIGNFSRDFKLIFKLSPDEWLGNQLMPNNVNGHIKKA
jgi:AraC-like DNA-binding protein